MLDICGNKTMKLYTILFETDGLTSFTPPEFMLVEWGGSSEQALTLIHVNSYKEMIKKHTNKERRSASLKKWCVAFISTGIHHKGDCSDAAEINYAARSENYPGAGMTIYALQSKHLNAPITSDRDSSTSDKAKGLWAKIENSDEWEKLELDNFLKKSDGRDPVKYYDAEGSWPSREIKQLSGPKTPDVESDDCNLPASDETAINKKTGTFNAYRYKGSLDPQPLLVYGEQVMEEVATELNIPVKEQMSVIRNGSDDLFHYSLL